MLSVWAWFVELFDQRETSSQYGASLSFCASHRMGSFIRTRARVVSLVDLQRNCLGLLSSTPYTGSPFRSLIPG